MARERVLVIVRHGHRSLKDPAADNGLSQKGRTQAKRFRKLFLSEFGKNARPRLMSSPKRRCLETLKPLARRLDRSVTARRDLREMDPAETPARFRARVVGALRAILGSAGPLTVLSTHGDWAPLALRFLTGARARFAKGGWARVDLGPPARLTTLAGAGR